MHVNRLTYIKGDNWKWIWKSKQLDETYGQTELYDMEKMITIEWCNQTITLLLEMEVFWLSRKVAMGAQR